MEYDMILAGYRVKFLNPPNTPMPNVTFMVQLNEDDDIDIVLDMWSNDIVKNECELKLGCIILSTNSWIMNYCDSSDDDILVRNEKPVIVVNYHTMDVMSYYHLMNDNAINRYPIGTSDLMLASNEIKYIYNMDFVHRFNRHNPYIYNGYIDVVISLIYLPNNIEDIDTSLLSDIMVTIIRDVYDHMIPVELAGCVEIHFVGANYETMCFELTVQYSHIGLDVPSRLYAVQAISKQFITFDKNVFIYDEAYDKLMMLIRGSLMDEKGFWEVTNLKDNNSQRCISIKQNKTHEGDELITVIPKLIRYELDDNDVMLYNRDPLPENTIYYDRSDSSYAKEVARYMLRNTSKKKGEFDLKHPVILMKVPRDKCTNSNYLDGLCVDKRFYRKIFVVTLTHIWFAWYASY